MGLSRGRIRFILLVLNTLCIIDGVVSLIMGTIGTFRFRHINKLLSNSMGFFPIFIIVFGITVFLASFVVFYGIYRKRRRLLLICGIILLVLFSIHLCSSMFGVVIMINYVNNTAEQMGDEWLNVTHLYDDYPRDFKYRVDNIQQKLHCCGGTSAMDYPHEIPISCCKEQELECPPSEAFQNGCLQATLKYLDKTLKIITYVALGLCVIEQNSKVLIHTRRPTKSPCKHVSKLVRFEVIRIGKCLKCPHLRSTQTF